MLWTELTPVERAEEESKLRDDVVLFAERFLDWRPHPAQERIMRDKHKHKVIAAGRRFGKSEMLAIELLHMAVFQPASIQYVVSLTQDQAGTIFDMCENFLSSSELSPLIEKVSRAQLPSIKLKNGSLIHARSCSHNGDYLRGKKAHRVVIDEAAYIKDRIVAQVIAPMLFDYDGTLILISTPFGRNWFYDKWISGMVGSDDKRYDPSYGAFQFTSYDNPYLKPAVIDEYKRTMFEEQYRCEVMAEFIDDQSFVFKWNKLDEVVEDYEYEVMPDGRRMYAIGADIAKDVDFTVIVVLDITDSNKITVAHFERFNHKTYEYITERLLELSHAYNPTKVVVDAMSAGSPIVERLKDAIPQIEGYTFANTLQNPKKVLLVQSLRLGIDQRRIRLPSKETFLMDEMRYYSYKITENGIVTMSAPSGKHDDCVMALSLAWSACVLPTAELTVQGVASKNKAAPVEGGPILVGDRMNSVEHEQDFGNSTDYGNFYNYR